MIHYDIKDILNEHREEIIEKMKEADADAYRYNLYFTVCLDSETGNVWVHSDCSSYFRYADDSILLLKTYNHQYFDILFDIERSNDELLDLCGLSEESIKNFDASIAIETILKESYPDEVEKAREKAIDFEISEKDFDEELDYIIKECAKEEEN